MPIIKCPCCGERFKPKYRKFREFWRKRPQCPHCGAHLEPANPLLFGGLAGVLFGGIILGIRYSGIENQWFVLGIMAAVALVVGSILSKILLRWRPVVPHLTSCAAVKFWSRVRSVALAASITAIALVMLNNYLLMRTFVAEPYSEEALALVENIQKIHHGFLSRAHTGLGIFGLTLVCACFASIMRGRAVDAEWREYEQHKLGSQGSAS